MTPGAQLAELAVLGALSAARGALGRDELLDQLCRAGVAASEARGALDRLAASELVREAEGAVEMTGAGARTLLERHAAIARALDPSPSMPAQEDCPSVPFLTTVQTVWMDAVSLNYAVDADALQGLLPPPLEPERHRGTAWVQILMSSLREMRPQGLSALFGVNFYQVSYRAAVCWRDAQGTTRRAGYFVRSETNHEVMRAVGNALAEFKFHAFGAAEMVMLRQGDHLSVGVTPEPAAPGGRLVGVFDTRPLPGPPPGSVWRSLAELQEPLVECYDAVGVDAEGGHLYVLTIDRDPWNARFVAPIDVYSEWLSEGPLARGARLDSVLHIRECAYRWRPLRREPLVDRTDGKS